MLPYYLETLSPIIKPYLNAILAEGKYGEQDITNSKLFEHLNGFVTLTKSPEPFEKVDHQMSVPLRHLTDTERIDYGKVHLDIILPSVDFRTNTALNERYRKNSISLKHLRKIIDGPTKHSLGAVGPFGRKIIDRINELDEYSYTQQSIRPEIIA